MKVRTLIIAMLVISRLAFGQDTEFTTYPNGLMYSEPTMNQIKLIVESLNLKFKVCELNKTYYAKAQAKGHYVSLEKGKRKQAIQDMKNNMPLSQFLKKYPQASKSEELLIVKYKYRNYDNEEVVEFSSMALNSRYGYELEIENNPKLYDQPLKDKWVRRYDKDDDDDQVRAFFITTEFETAPIPVAYARMIQYSDCMVDTSAQVFRENASAKSPWDEEANTSAAVAEFLAFVHKETNRPIRKEEPTDEESMAFWHQYRAWDSLRIGIIDNRLVQTEKFQNLLKAAVADAIQKGESDGELEEYAERYHSKKAALELKRSRRVVGGCSMDSGPRRHALKIALLSAETANWETFLRAHLDIMNDRFERVSDGSYAWAARETYIKELEELDINVPDLMLGISLRMENPSQNHYFGSIGRLGRALSETKYASEMETRMLDMIKDKQLDDYNRIMAYYLFLNYNSHIENEARNNQNRNNLKAAVKELPEYLASQIKIE